MEEISYEDAYKWYLNDHYDEIIPFKSLKEYDFLTFLEIRGFKIIDMEEEDDR